MLPAISFEIRRASAVDVAGIAEAHIDSIRSIGPQYYPSDIVNEWGVRVADETYTKAMALGEVFFVASGPLGGTLGILGFSSHRNDGGKHATAVYVRGTVSRLGIGSALLRYAEGSAIAAGATSLSIDASLAAVQFYKANGFDEVRRSAQRLRSGRMMPSVVMRKDLLAMGAKERIRQ